MIWRPIGSARASRPADDEVALAARWLARTRSLWRGSDQADAAEEELIVPSDGRDAEREVAQLWSDLNLLRNEPRVRRLVEEGAKARDRARGKRRFVAMAAGLALVLLLGQQTSRRPLDAAESSQPALRFATPTGRQQIITLEDGSTVHLDANSELRVTYGPRQRRIMLDRGRAMFDVHPNRAWPFVVVARDNDVTALGTRFSVNREGEQLDVVLLHGRVQVDATDRAHRTPAVTMEPGTALTIQGDRRVLRVVDPAAAAAWTTGKLVFDDVPLSQAVDEVNRYTRAPVIIADPKVGRRRISAILRAGDVEAFLVGVSQSDIATVHRTPNRIVLGP